MGILIEDVPVRFHPRAFSAFGADLVTNDEVAITELVKNSYDAFATEVTVSISDDEIEIRDNGSGMTRDIIKNAWAVVATPFKQKEPFVEKGGKVRRVSGNKGLGRFSAARLGRYVEIQTKSESDSYIRAFIDWDNLVNAENLSDCSFKMRISEPPDGFEQTGTVLKISGLHDTWNAEKTQDLKNSLARLISPFEKVNDFRIRLSHKSLRESVFIETPPFIEHPVYLIKGNVSEEGEISWDYNFSPKRKADGRNEKGIIPWNKAFKGFSGEHDLRSAPEKSYFAGPFSFEIRAWDLDPESIADVSDTFDIKKREIRRSIAQYNGLSIYRDNILTLPKSDASKDWLGMDIRRVSSIGKRIGTSQIVGLISITTKDNPEIKDTTDREKLVDTEEYGQFCRIIETVITNLDFTE